MAVVNGFSDSQESVLIDPEIFDELNNDPNFRPVLDQYHVITQQKSELKCEMPQTYIHYPNQDQMAYMGGNLTTQIPIKEEFPGPLHFELELVTQPTGKNWVYSQTLKKVFIDMEQTLPLRFKWSPTLDGLWVRTTMVFSLDQYCSEPVQRCHNHMAPENRYNDHIDQKQLKHVVRCMNPASIYEENNGHLSVLAPLGTPQAGCEYVPMNFQFFCKNSCNSGMNRRPTELIFTLENDRCQIFGRRRLLVRVCSCPKRDKEKEETEAGGEKILMSRPSSKKRKLQSLTNNKKVISQPTSVDNAIYHVSFEVPGKENYLAILNYAFDLMAGQAARTSNPDFYKSYMDDLYRKTQ